MLNCKYGRHVLTEVCGTRFLSTRYYLDLGTLMNSHLEVPTMYILVEYKEPTYDLY